MSRIELLYSIVLVVGVGLVLILAAVQVPQVEAVLGYGEEEPAGDAGEAPIASESEGDQSEQPLEDLPYLSETIRVTEDGRQVVTNPADLLVVVNKQRSLPADYVPDELVVPDVPFPFEGDHPRKLMRKVAAQALEELFKAAEEQGFVLFAISGYRSYETQKAIFEYNVSKAGSEEAANRFSARPGESEHQTGLAMDVSSPNVDLRLVQEFGQTREGRWLEENAPSFGFIIRYPEGMESITGYEYEPWHLRFVGVGAAADIAQRGVTLEEYLTKPEAGAAIVLPGSTP